MSKTESNSKQNNSVQPVKFKKIKRDSKGKNLILGNLRFDVVNAIWLKDSGFLM